MSMNKREFLKASGLLGLASGMYSPLSAMAQSGGAVMDMAASAQPISTTERLQRIQKAQHLLHEAGMAALLLESGSALDYFTGVRWGRSERYTGAVIPATGDIAFITPYFEEPTMRERMAFGEDVRTWNEHENPFALVEGILKDRGIKSGEIGIEETVRYFIVDGVRQASPNYTVVAGKNISRGCRMYKSATEIELMQIANNITLAAYEALYKKIELGMAPSEISSLMSEETRKRGGRPLFSMVLLNEASAYPHGTRQPQILRENSVVLMDCGCEVHGYESDISRTWVFGEPTRKQRQVWSTVKQGQELALETAQIGAPAGKVDETVRKFYESKGYGPGYLTPGLSHRLGHGIGMDGHEPVNFVMGETKALEPGMCFSNEPGIYIFDEFGVRLEDCLYMTEDGPKLFTQFSNSIDKPFG